MKKRFDNKILVFGIIAVLLIGGLTFISFGNNISGAFSFSKFKTSISKYPVVKTDKNFVKKSDDLMQRNIADFSNLKKSRPASLGDRCTEESAFDRFCDEECYYLAQEYNDIYFDEDCCNKNPFLFPVYCSEQIIESDGQMFCDVDDLQETLPFSTVIELREGIRHINVCVGDNHVRHIFCDGNDFLYEDTTVCREGTTCQNGLCGGEESEICFDSDPENDEFVFGFVSDGDYYSRDMCDLDTYSGITQYSCLPNWQVRPGQDSHFLRSDGLCGDSQDLNSICVSGECVSLSDYTLFKGGVPENEQDEPGTFDSGLLMQGLSCVDSDNGLDTSVKGDIRILVNYENVHSGVNVVLNNEEIRGRSDGCIYSNNCMSGEVREYYCEENDYGVPFISSRDISCKANELCIEGACVDLGEKVCRDTDSGRNYDLKGEVFYDILRKNEPVIGDFHRVEDNFEKLAYDYDYCRNDYSLKEYYCDDGGFICSEVYDTLQQNKFCSDGKLTGCIDYDDWRPDLISQSREPSSAKTTEMEHNDYCVSDSVVAEMTCQGDVLVEEHVQCEQGYVCISGECDWLDESSVVDVVEY